MIIKIATFNLFQFCSPNFSFYTKKEKFQKEDWEEKKIWIKEQLQKMDCDIVGFQEVFSQEELKELVLECGFKEFVVAENPKLDEKNKVLNYANSIKDDIENLKIEHSGNKASKYVTISLGVVCKNAIEINSSEELYKQADINLYEAKRSGRNCVVIK